MTDDEREQWRLKVFGWNGKEFHQEHFEELVKLSMEETEAEAFEQCLELWAEGWTSENPHPKHPCHSMSLYWRRPPKGKRKLGKRYLSTGQAHRAMMDCRP